MVYFKRHTFIRRSFELISLYSIAPVALNAFLAPFLLDSKPESAHPSGSAYSSSSSSSTKASDSKARLKHEGRWPKRIISPDNMASIRVKRRSADGKDSDVSNELKDEKEEMVSLEQFVRRHCTSLFADWDPTWWLESGHLQTFWSSAGVGYFGDIDPIDYERKLLEMPDGGVIAVDLTAATGEANKDTPIVIVLPGLTGGSQASYVRTFLTIASNQKSEGGLGFRGVVVNSRGCGNVPLRTPQISAGSPDDLRAALLYVRSRYPDAPLYGVGFSLGGTVLSKYLGQEGAASEIRAGCVVACPWNLSKNSELMESQFLYRHVYSRALAKSYLALLNRSLPSLTIHPSHHFHQHLSTLQTIRSPTFTTVNTHLTAIIGGPQHTFPHPSVGDFYQWASCQDDIRGVRVPLLAINADNDPIVRTLPEEEIKSSGGSGSGAGKSETEAEAENGEKGHVVMVVTSGGGHLGWFSGKDGKRRWISRPIAEWLRAVDEEVIWSPSPSSSPLQQTPSGTSTPMSGQSSSSSTLRSTAGDLVNPAGRLIRARKLVLGEDGFTRAEGDRIDIGYRVITEEEFGVGGSGAESPGSVSSGANGDVSVPGAMAGL